MISKFGIETNGTYLKYYQKYIRMWVVETQDGQIRHFNSEDEANEFVGLHENGMPLPLKRWHIVYTN